MKPAWQSKRVWWTVLGAVAAIVQAFTGAAIEPEWQLVAWNVVMIVIALVSKEPIAWLSAPPADDGQDGPTQPELPLAQHGTGERGSALAETLWLLAAGAVAFAVLALLLLTPGCGVGLSRRGTEIAGAGVATLEIGCGAVTEQWCKPGEEIIPASVCRWLIPGCLGARGLASVILDAVNPQRPATTGLYLMRAEAPDGPVVDMQEWLAACDAPGVPLCEEVGEARRQGHDLVILATD